MSIAEIPAAAESIEAEVEREERLFELAQRKAKVYSSSTLVPKEYQGSNNIGNVLIAQNMATRMSADPLQVMQNLYVVHGKPGWSAQFLIACFNTCGRFSAIKYRFNEDKSACVAYATETATGETIEGTEVSIEMARAEGWSTKSGSKWKTMPEQMLRYRAAAFLIRTTAPEIGMGLMTREELQDIGEESHSGRTADVMARLGGNRSANLPEPEAPAVDATTNELVDQYVDEIGKLGSSKERDELIAMIEADDRLPADARKDLVENARASLVKD